MLPKKEYGSKLCLGVLSYQNCGLQFYAGLHSLFPFLSLLVQSQTRTNIYIVSTTSIVNNVYCVVKSSFFLHIVIIKISCACRLVYIRHDRITMTKWVHTMVPTSTIRFKWNIFITICVPLLHLLCVFL